MAVSIRNVEKFFADHPEYGAQGHDILPQMRWEIGNRRIIMGHAVRSALGDILADQFFQEFSQDGAHLQMSFEDLDSERSQSKSVDVNSILAGIFVEIEAQCPHPYHKAGHTREVLERVTELAVHVVPPLVDSQAVILKEAALFHDYGHCGQTIRQTCSRDVPRRDLSNEEYAAEIAVERFRDVYDDWYLTELRSLILATSFGQANPQFQFYRPYKPETLLQKLLALADIGGFVNGFKAWVEESLRVLQEADMSGLPADFESWQKGRRGFVGYIRSKLQELEPNLDPAYYRQLTTKLNEVARGVDNELEAYRSQFDRVRADRLAALR